MATAVDAMAMGSATLTRNKDGKGEGARVISFALRQPQDLQRLQVVLKLVVISTLRLAR